MSFLIPVLRRVVISFFYCITFFAFYHASFAQKPARGKMNDRNFFLSGGNAMIYGIKGRDKEVVKHLIKEGVDLNSSICRGRSPLNLSLKLEAFDIAMQLLSYGADVDFVDEFGDSAITLSIKSKQFKLARLLISKSNNVDVPDKRGETPLMLAVRYQNLDLFKILLQRNADIFWKNSDNLDIFDLLDKYTDIILMYEFLRLIRI